MHTRNVFLAVVGLLAGIEGTALAQPVGTFRWQLQPFCNVVTVAITQNGAVYRLEGTDDQCGNGADAASVTGTAFPNADGTIGFGLNIVTAPGGRPVHVDAAISLGNFSGTWRDSAGGSGAFVLTPGAGNGGNARPLPSTGASLPAAIVLRQDGGFVAGGTDGVGAIPASGVGVRSMWYPGKAAFRAGRVTTAAWEDANIGTGSAAFGTNTTASGLGSLAVGSSTLASSSGSVAMGTTTSASGPNSLAIGSSTSASASASVAMGSSTIASGPDAFAAGSRTTASGGASVALGSSTTASGGDSVAMGSFTTAGGGNSLAIGSSTIASGNRALAGGLSSQAIGATSLAFGDNVRADGTGSVALGSFAAAIANGSFVFSDRSQPGVLHGAVNPNEFSVRATGGVTFQTGLAANVGVRLASNGTQWLSLSDARTKHRFRELDTDDVLARIAAMPVTEWSYDAQDAGVRHIGPTAQDFHAAFGLGEDPLRIGTLDADGVALAGVKAVETRTRALRDEQEALRRRVAALEQALADALALVRALRSGR
jgi:Chaperone of endosialidase